MKIVTNGTLFDGTGRDPVQRASVAIDDEGRITDAGKLDRQPRDAEVIDVGGMTVMPGLIDCHVHFFVDLKPMHDTATTPMTLRAIEAVNNARATLDAGVTSVRDLAGAPLGFKMAVERGLIPGPRMRIAISALSQTGGHGDLLLPSGMVHPLLPPTAPPEWPNAVCDGVDDVRRTTRSVLRAGADLIKLCSTGGVLSPSDEPGATQFTREEIAVMVYEARAQGKPCAAHALATEGIRNAIVSGVESIEHGIYLDESVISEMKERGTFLVPTLQAPVAAVRRGEEQPSSVLPQSMRKAREVFEDHRASIRMAAESGVRIAMGTDAGVGEHGTNAEELRLMVETGMTPMQAIVAATGTASQCIRMGDDVGTLEPGKLADLLVVDGDPLDDIAVLQDPSRLLMIMQGGRAHKDLIAV